MSAVESDELRESSGANPLVLRLREALISCFKSCEGGDLNESESSVSELVNILDSVSDNAASHPDKEDLQNDAFEVLSEIYQFLCSSSLGQVVIDRLSFELPKAVSKFVGVSGRCLEIADGIIDRFVATCSPRDMLLVLCEALDSLGKMVNLSGYSAPLLHGLSKVFISIRRRHFEQVKNAVPLILKVFKDLSSESEIELEYLFDRAVGIAHSVSELCMKLEGRENKKLCALLGLYLLQIMARLSVTMGYELPSCLRLVTQLTQFFPNCGLTYLGLITGCDVDTMTTIVVDKEDDIIKSLSDVKLGASLAVIWGKISDGVAQAAKEDLIVVKGELQREQIKRWQAVDMLKYIFSSVNLPWELRKYALDFLLCIMSGDISPQTTNDEQIDCSIYMPSLFTALQAVTMVIMYAPDRAIRKKAFDALKRVLADIPTPQRYGVLEALITNCESSSMIAILLDLVRNDLHKESSQRISLGKDEAEQAESCVCSTTFVLKLVESVLRPSKGGPPPLPEQGDAVLSALNLYRFALIKESIGKHSSTVLLSKHNLLKAYYEWLLPLRTLVTGMAAENKSNDDELAIEAVCGLNPIELVLYRCIELVEERLEHAA